MTTTDSNNQLIAEFMGGTWEEKPHHPLIGIKSYNEKDLPKTTYIKVFTIPLETLPSEYAFGVFSIGKLQYHASWDWLMPVVEKIDTLFGEDDTVDDMINRVVNEVEKKVSELENN